MVTKPLSKAEEARQARRAAALRLVTDEYLPGRVLLTARVYDDQNAQYRTMPVSVIVRVRDLAEFERLWLRVRRVAESDAWTSQ